MELWIGHRKGAFGVRRSSIRLLPYIYSSAWQVTHSGGNLMRALPLDFGADRHVFDIADQFMFGPSILVNPVVEPGVDSRSVYLPKGTAWNDFWTGRQTAGGQTVHASAPLDRIPLYVRAGSILPLERVKQDAMEPENDIELRIYRGADGSFDLYEDQGDGYAYEKGDFSTIHIEWNETSRTLTIGKRAGAFHGIEKTMGSISFGYAGTKGPAGKLLLLQISTPPTRAPLSASICLPVCKIHSLSSG